MNSKRLTTVTQQSVILLHGLGRSEQCMEKMADSLRSLGYQVINCRYPSFSLPIEELAEQTISAALQLIPEQHQVHFVTHSMGGILVRLYLHQRQLDNLGRVVMLGPPNKGSELIDLLHKVLTHSQLQTQAGMQLSCKPSSVPNRLGKANFEVGIIAGKRTVNPILSTLLSGENDGKVTVESSKLAGMKDHLTLPVTHPFMMKNNRVITQVEHFLEKGCFVHS